MLICGYTVHYIFKGSMSQDFLPLFFHDSNPSRPPKNRPKYFRIRFRFRQDIFQFLKGSVVCIPMWKSYSAVCTIPRSQTPWFASYHGVRLCGLHHTTESRKLNVSKNTDESSSTVYITPRPRVSKLCAWFDSKFYNCNFFVMPKDINMNIIAEVTNCLEIFFTFGVFL